jgi:Ca2+-binding EF-hand superfamily protein
MKTVFVLATAVAAVALLPLSAQAAGGRFNKADANRDGRVTLQEFETLTNHQMMNGRGQRAEKFRQLSPQQRAKRVQRRFYRLDEGGKGYLTRGDFKAARDAARKRRAGQL